MRGTLIAFIAAVVPRISSFKPVQGPLPPEPNSTLKLLVVGLIFLTIVGGAISSILTRSSAAGGESEEKPK